MSGRFMMNIILICIIVLFHLFAKFDKHCHTIFLVALLSITFVQTVFLSNIVPYRNSDITDYRNVVFRERDYYKHETTVQHHFLPNFTTTPVHTWIDKVEKHKKKRGVIVQRNIGMYGFYSRRQRIIIDTFALADPFLARLPIIKSEKYWRAGHYRREVPAGYVKARATGDTRHMNPELAEYYRLLREVTAGDIWSFRRIKAIFGFQTNAYDYLLADASAILHSAATKRKAYEERLRKRKTTKYILKTK